MRWAPLDQKGSLCKWRVDATGMSEIMSNWWRETLANLLADRTDGPALIEETHDGVPLDGAPNDTPLDGAPLVGGFLDCGSLGDEVAVEEESLTIACRRCS